MTWPYQVLGFIPRLCVRCRGPVKDADADWSWIQEVHADSLPAEVRYHCGRLALWQVYGVSEWLTSLKIILRSRIAQRVMLLTLQKICTTSHSL